ncbi:type IA DNA topoisomerase [Paenibacillus sedimenti]|uniref:DNA topoisomerase n=1 Tax=Paenibacillus sedimenti TaxID=2770274 RepID=A0A926QLQ9_9BACL|nr:type IA DNA topoisomerase [Paenibacillus sedimenti]MBD0383083.1 DNA topoisomerase 3 [Paenibacillus sedimenti]
MKTLVIAEKPDMGRNIASAIEPKAVNKRSYLEGESYIITWAIGHLIELAEPDQYDEKYKKWSIDHLPIIPDTFKLVPNPRTYDQLKVIAELAKKCDKLVNACDAGREGQHIFSLIQRHLGLQHPVKRLWISDLTSETIRTGFETMKDGSEYENLTRAARSRSEADWLIGMNGSRAFTTKHNVLLSVGRVQTPVLALIYDRQKQIEAFSSLKFFELEGHFTQGDTTYKGMWQGERMTDKEKVEALAAKVKGKPGRIVSYEVKDTKEYPFKLYDLTLLQREANGKFGFSAKKTLDTAQALYEKHKVISYPRTNSNYVTEQNIPEMHRSLSALQGTAYNELVQGANRNLVHKNNKSICNPSKVEDHHAILPTNRKASGLNPDEQKLYDLIVRRFLSQFYPPAEYKMHTVMTEIEQEMFKTTVKELLQLGWKVIYADQKKEKAKSSKGKDKEEEEEEEVEVNEPFSVDPQADVMCSDAIVKEKDTQPPKHFTEGTLLKAMESAGKQIEDEELRDAMKDSGLGTPATRAATIERLKKVGYVDMQGKKIVLTQKGRMAVELIRGAGIELLTSPEMTGQWERRLNEISRGTASDEQFMLNVKKFATLIVNKVRVQARASKTAFEGETPQAQGGKRGSAKSSAATASRKKQGEESVGNGASSTIKPQAAKQPDGSPSLLAACPRPGCGGSLFMGRKGYGCSHYKEGCKFVIWKESFGRSLTDTQIQALVQKGKTAKLKLVLADGTSVDGRIVLKDPQSGELGTETE